MRQTVSLVQKIDEAAMFVRARIGGLEFPKTAAILGSGFKSYVDSFAGAKKMALSEIPNFPVPEVVGHGNSLYLVNIGGKSVAILSGRVHLYEGHSAHDCVFGVRLLHRLGVENLLLTNAAGSLDPKIKAGKIVVLNDYINLTGQSCLVGPAAELAPTFVSMAPCFDKAWSTKIKKIATGSDGVYVGVLGPQYETKSEVLAMAKMGGDVVGMSTVQEIIAANHLGMKLAGISFVTNVAGGLAGPVSHKEVLDVAKKNEKKLHEIFTKSLTCI